jgi:hypothetical protein
MQAMNRRIGVAAVLAAALAAPLLAAGPASAGAIIGCPAGDCSISLSKLIVVKGDRGHAGANRVPFDVEPPCLWNPIGDATTGSNAIIQEWQPTPPRIYGIDVSYAQAKKLVAHPKPGEWFELPVNPKASPAGRAACLKLPLYYFVPPGGTPPVPPIPPRLLAEYAYNHMRIPLPAITISPQAKGYVNLATFVWGSWPLSPTTGLRGAYKVTARLMGANEPPVTVWAQARTFDVNTTGHGTVFSGQGDCGPTGSHHPLGHAPPSAGAGTPPDCGVLWQGPDANATVSATVTWRVTWGVGDLAGPGPHFLTTVQLTGRPANIPVSEIQSINGG